MFETTATRRPRRRIRGARVAALLAAPLLLLVTSCKITDVTDPIVKPIEKTFEEIFPGAGPLADTDKKLSYYNVSAGYNVFPGEIFLGNKYAKASSIYLIGGVGSTKFANQRRQTFNVGFGFRVLFSDRFAMRVDVRDHIFSYDLLNVRQNTQNLELTTGIAYYF